MGQKKQNQNHKPNHRKNWVWWEEKVSQKDNNVRKYDERDLKWSKPLEEQLQTAIEEERDKWRKPYSLYEDENGIQKDFEPNQTIRERLEKDDAAFRNTSIAQRYTRIRVPSLNRNNTDWENFYRTFPHLAVDVALGKERFCDGAKLKYIPLFKIILDEVWPEDLTRWTETQYNDLLMRGRITQKIQNS